MAASLDRSAVLADPDLAGVRLCRALSDQFDRWLADLYETEVGEPAGVALVAVGGYGRRELSPQSDVDLVLLHRGRGDIGEVAERIWYPIWDQSVKLGHAVRTVREALALAADDLDTATSLLSCRCVAGDHVLAGELHDKAIALWQKRAKRWLGALARSVRERHDREGEVAFLLEPELKEGRGGLRDVHAIRWAEAARSVMLEGDDDELARSYETILAARVELHRRTGRPGDRLVLEEQDAVAEALHYGDADDLMRAISAAARRIAWSSDEVWDRVESTLAGPFQRRAARDRDLGPGVVLRDGVIELKGGADPAVDPLLVLRVATAAASEHTRIERHTLNTLASTSMPLPEPWPAVARDLLVELLLAGDAALPVIEALDQKGIWLRLIPEWEAVRCRPQRNAYHTYTVDRHLWQAAINASALVDGVDRPDLLVVGALLHDIGKGYPGDHTEVGIGIVATIAARMGFPDDDVEVLREMVRHHLLLPDIAVRRDLADEGTIDLVARKVGSLRNLELLDALTEADSLATGPAAWNDWKAELVGELVRRTSHVLGGGAVAEVATASFPSDEHLALMAKGERHIRGDGDRLLVISPDRAGMFSRVAGALALNGLAVLEASAHSDDRGMAIELFRVESSFGPIIAWDRVIADVERALDGRLALHARLMERSRVYDRPPRTGAPQRTPPSVLVDNDISGTATVVEVRAADAVGVLYRITRAVADLDLDIRTAKVQTLGPDVVDSFYVRTVDGSKVVDPEHLAELEREIVHALS